MNFVTDTKEVSLPSGELLLTKLYHSWCAKYILLKATMMKSTWRSMIWTFLDRCRCNRSLSVVMIDYSMCTIATCQFILVFLWNLASMTWKLFIPLILAPVIIIVNHLNSASFTVSSILTINGGSFASLTYRIRNERIPWQ